MSKYVVCVPRAIYLASADVAASSGLAQNRPSLGSGKAEAFVSLRPDLQLAPSAIVTQRTEMRGKLLRISK